MTGCSLLSESKDIVAACRESQASETTYHRWRNQFGGLRNADVRCEGS